MLSILASVPIGVGLIVIALLVRYLVYGFGKATGQNPQAPITVNRGEALKAIAALLAGNRELALQAAQDSLQIWIGEGSIEHRLLELAFDDVQRRLKDPAADVPIIRIAAFITGKTEQQMYDIFYSEFLGPKPVPHVISPAVVLPNVAAQALQTTIATTIAAPLIALALCLCLTGSSTAASPLRVPDRWEPTEAKVVLDSPVFYSPVHESQRGEILLPNNAYVSHQGEIQPNDYQYQERCEYQTSYQQGYYDRGIWYPGKLIGRWVRNGRHPIARGGARVVGAIGRGVGRVVSAPFRWLFRGRRR